MILPETRVILKGALLFLFWMEEPHRHTRDLDLLGTGDPAPERLITLFREICHLEVEEDGLVFDPTTVTARQIREENIYGGVRVKLTAYLEKARIAVQIDVGYGDAVTPAPEAMSFPTLLDFPAPLLRAYPRETVIAEKFSALVELDMDNSRMKDFFDLWTLAKQFHFEEERLRDALVATFARRNMSLPLGTPTGLSSIFWSNPAKQIQWRTFLAQSASSALQTLTLQEAIEFASLFLLPVLQELNQGNMLHQVWLPGGPWQPEATRPFTRIDAVIHPEWWNHLLVQGVCYFGSRRISRRSWRRSGKVILPS